MKNKIIRKSNDLVEAQYGMNLWEMRVFIKMIALLSKEDSDFQQYQIELKDFIKEFELEKNKNAYKLLKDAARSLQQKIVVLSKKLEDGTTELLEIPMVVGFAHNIDKKSYIKLSFHPDMKPYLLELQSRFLIYDVRNIIKLPSPYSIRIYELAKQYASLGKRILTVERLKAMLGVEEKYERYTHFKQKILNKAKIDIAKHTDITVEFKEIKEGRRVVKLEFLITTKKETATTDTEPAFKQDKLTGLLKQIGITETTIKKWTSTYEGDYIRQRIEYLNKQDTSNAPIKNKAAYLHSIIDKDISLKKNKQDKAAITKRVNAILFSNPKLEQQIRAKHGEVSQEAMERIIQKKFPGKFK